jgi:ribosome-associated protein
MLDSLAEEVIKTAKHNIDFSAKIEGQAMAGWLLIDLGDIIVHLFAPDQRQYYRLEQLWDSGKVLLHLQ